MPFWGLAWPRPWPLTGEEDGCTDRGQALCRLFDVGASVVFDHGHDLIKDAALQGAVIADKDLPTGQPRRPGETIEQVVNTLVRQEGGRPIRISKPNLTPDQRWIRLAKPRPPPSGHAGLHRRTGHQTAGRHGWVAGHRPGRQA